ncbi:MAG: phospho-N-acetylmuramoyl-pentapeptide-transferase, partial [Clostridia bacterium]|nr:phospho-N-acetylmuramoyl-pentapeptide-transferase [Clostridia bacterium]
MTKIWTIIAAISSFGIAALFGKWLVPFLKKVNFRQTEREEGIDLHKGKQGTPMMGGFMFILS